MAGMFAGALLSYVPPHIYTPVAETCSVSSSLGPRCATPDLRLILLPRQGSNRQTAYPPPSPLPILSILGSRQSHRLQSQTGASFFALLAHLRLTHGCLSHIAFVRSRTEADSPPNRHRDQPSRSPRYGCVLRHTTSRPCPSPRAGPFLFRSAKTCFARHFLPPGIHIAPRGKHAET
jgi:hypothetical protein